MMKTSTFIALMSVAAAAGAGCGETPSDAETKTAALFGAPVKSVRGFTRNDGVHGVVWKSLETGTVAEAEDNIGSDPARHDIGAAQVLNTPWGYKRSDNVNAVVYISTDQHLHEVTQSGSTGGWTDVDFATSFGIGAPLAANSVTNDANGYVRTDGINAVIYRATNGHIIEVSSNFGHSPPWLVSDLTTFTGAPNANGSAFAYIRSDSKNAIVYSASDFHVHEIASNFGHVPAWNDSDLFAASGVPTSTSYDPWGYKRFDNVNAVVFTTSAGRLYELSLTPGTPCSASFAWCWGQLTTDASTLSNRPSGYVRWDSRDAVVYVSNSNTLNELSLFPGQSWFEGVLPLSSQSLGTVTLSGTTQLFGHRAPGSNNSVLFEGNSSQSGTDPYEFYLPNGGSWHLHALDVF